jgi:hypothetical protein
VTQCHIRDINPYRRCYIEDSNLKHVPLVNISGFTAVLVLYFSPGDNDLSALQCTIFADTKNKKFKEHNNKPNTREERKKNQIQTSGNKFGPRRV